MPPLLLPSKIIAPAISSLLNHFTKEISNTDVVPMGLYQQMILDSAPVSSALVLIVEVALSYLGNYRNSDEGKQDFIRQNFEKMRGSFRVAVGQMLSCLPYGFSFSEVSYTVRNLKWVLDQIQLADPRYYKFLGTRSQIDSIKYKEPFLTEDLIIPYESGIHLVNQPYLVLGNNPYGCAMCRRALPYWQAHQVVMGALIIANQRQATPNIAIKVPKSDQMTQLFDASGNVLLKDGVAVEVPRAVAARMQLEELENTSVVATDIENIIDVLRADTDGSLFFSTLHYLQAMQYLSFLVADTIFSTAGSGGTGDSNLNAGHIEILLLMLSSQMENLKESLLEKIIRPLLDYNYPVNDDYGEFIAPEKPQDALRLLQVINEGVKAASFGEFDDNIRTRARTLAGIGL